MAEEGEAGTKRGNDASNRLGAGRDARPEGMPKGELVKVKYTHDAMIDLLIAQPGISQGEVAQIFGYTQSWVSLVINSDAFQARLASRKADLIDPTLTASIEERLRVLGGKVLDKLFLKAQNNGLSTDQEIDLVKATTRALGYGATQRSPTVVNNIAVLPAKEVSAESWAQANGGSIVEVDAVNVDPAD